MQLLQQEQTHILQAQVLAKVVTSVNRVDGVYETEVAVKLVLVPTTTVVLFTTQGNWIYY